MPRNLQISGKAPVVKQTQSGVVEGGLGDLGAGIASLGYDIRKTESKNNNLIVAVRSARDTSQVSLYKAQAKEREKAFVASQKNNWNEENLKEVQTNWLTGEKSALDFAYKQGTISTSAYENLRDFEMPKIYASAGAETEIQLGEAMVGSATANYETQRQLALNAGNVETANEVVELMASEGLIKPELVNDKLISNGRLAERGLLRNTIKNTVNQEDLALLGASLEDTKNYVNITLEDRAQMSDEVQNQQVFVLKSEQLPASKALKNSYQTGNLTEEQIWGSTAPNMDKELYAVLLRNRRTAEYRSIGGAKLGKLSKLVSTYMDGSFLWPGGTKGQTEEIIDFVKNNKVSNYVIMDLLGIMQDGYAGDNAVAYFGLDSQTVKYPRYIKDSMDALSTEFNDITSYLSPAEKLNAWGELYMPFYKGVRKISFDGSGFSMPNVEDSKVTKEFIDSSLEPFRQKRQAYDLKRQAEINLGAATAPEEYAASLAVGAELEGVAEADQEAVRSIMILNKISLKEAIEFHNALQRR